ncbi:beta-ketoacyl-ACP synthase I [Hydrocarboniclastica marina]|uniref:3-oxoacyl-[acyl-carrier-protein] synthase 1 n=1 Tax=Hydrocarboniclastica marina TaxID=2259620 RepID=A0A4P7XE95_9ALTE|nr:beta-ketoacyl-ACP synthase I [Hydrocarboniclastica marina]QCF25198.1 beta-ketoacyl-ACP synthase I [Hydrocarboniclastica marina]
MRRAVITGMGIVSCLGNNTSEVLDSLRQGRSGIRYNESYREKGFRSQVSGSVSVDLSVIDRKQRRFMGDSAAFAYLSLQQAIAQAGLTENQIKSDRTGIIAGSGGASSQYQIEAADILREKGVRKIGPYMVPRIMTSTVSACLATAVGIRGVNYSLSSACATSAHCIGHAVEQIQNGKQDIIFAGGGEEEHWGLTMLFDAMGALSTRYNDAPETASRPFDKDRDGFVIAGGGGMLVVEELEHARRRGATILAEVVGYGATSDGADMVAPSGEGAERCMRIAMANLSRPVDYVNAHGTSTPIGDITELRTLRRLFGDKVPPVSSTKSLSGHSLGAAGVHEAIYCLLMLQEQFIAGTLNLNETADEVADLNLPRTAQDASLDVVMSNSFGFGGTNATLVLQKPH